jgi:molybdopterin converting factor small subunit
MTILRIPTPLRPYTDGASQLEISGGSVGEALDELITQYPALQTHLFAENGELRAFVNLFLNDEDVRHLRGRETKIEEGDSLMILPSIAGGR